MLSLHRALPTALPAVVAIGRGLCSGNVRTAIPVAQAAGIAMAEAVAAGCEVVEYSPNQVKQAVAGVGGASKDQMERMVQTILGIAHPIRPVDRSEEHTSELQSLMRISYAVFCLKKKQTR